MTALAITRSSRATAVRIAFAFLPRAANRPRKARIAGLCLAPVEAPRLRQGRRRRQAGDRPPPGDAPQQLALLAPGRARLDRPRPATLGVGDLGRRPGQVTLQAAAHRRVGAGPEAMGLPDP